MEHVCGQVKKPFLLFALSVVFVCACCWNSTRASAADLKGKEKEKEYVIVTKDGKSYDALVEKYDVDSDEMVADAESLEDNHIALVSVTEQEAAHISRETGISCLEENIILEANTEDEDEVYDAHQWNLDAIHLDGCKAGDDQIKIALIDSGVSYSDDIPVEERVCFIPGEEDVSERYEDATGHGTAMAGAIAAEKNDEGITGIAPGSQIYSLRVLDSSNTCTLGQLVNAVYWAIDHDMDIINLSLGTSVDSERAAEKIDTTLAWDKMSR